MSGGVAYLLDADAAQVNTEMADLEPLAGEDGEFLRELIGRHPAETGSVVAAGLLADWEATLPRFTG